MLKLPNITPALIALQNRFGETNPTVLQSKELFLTQSAKKEVYSITYYLIVMFFRSIIGSLLSQHRQRGLMQFSHVFIQNAYVL